MLGHTGGAPSWLCVSLSADHHKRTLGSCDKSRSAATIRGMRHERVNKKNVAPGHCLAIRTHLRM